MCLLDTGDVSYRVFPPEETILMKTDEELEVRCFADGNREKTLMVRPILYSNTLLNLGNGFVPGFALDEHTKSHYLYPDVVVVDFTTIPYQKAEQPTHSNRPDAPEIEDIDPTRGGLPALYSSDLTDSHVPPERQNRSFYSEQPDAPAYQPMWHAGQANPYGADPIELDLGDDRRVDFHLEPNPPWQVEGRVLDAFGAPASQALVLAAYPPDPDRPGEAPRRSSGA